MSVLKIETTVKTIPCLPAAKAVSTFIPKPSPTTDTCSKMVVAFLLYERKGCPITFAVIKPSNSAIGGET